VLDEMSRHDQLLARVDSYFKPVGLDKKSLVNGNSAEQGEVFFGLGAQGDNRFETGASAANKKKVKERIKLQLEKLPKTDVAVEGGGGSHRKSVRKQDYIMIAASSQLPVTSSSSLCNG
jgi:hypothetical protein